MNKHSLSQTLLRLARPAHRAGARAFAVLSGGIIALVSPVILRAIPISSPPALQLVGQTNPPIYNSAAAGQPVTSPRLVDLEFANPLVNPSGTTKVRILLPANYATGHSRYPVLYLLHGAKTGHGLAKGEQYEWWTRWASTDTLFNFTADKDVVVVMPTGGALSFYSDWFNGGAFGAPAWETFHLAQLIHYIESNYRVRADRGGRVIAGVSMGGFGAICYASRHPDLFAGVYSFSGALNNLAFAAMPAGTPSLISEGIWGSFASQEVRWRAHNPVDLAENLAPITIWFRTATGIPHESVGEKPPPNDTETPVELAMEARVLPLNEQFHQRLQQLDIPHHYLVEPIGGHTGYHFMESLILAWPSIEADFSRSVKDPAQFNYRTIEPRFRIWNWEFAVEREAVEFLSLSDVTSKSLKIQGSGLVTVKTAPIYRPNHLYSVTVTNASGEKMSAERMTADTNGRLEFKITLGESHRLQQFTPEQKVAEAQDPAYWKNAQVLISP